MVLVTKFMAPKEVARMIHKDDVMAELYYKMAASTISNEMFDRQIGELVAMLDDPNTVG
jgi:hypothetical protein